MEFLDEDGQTLGEEKISPAVGGSIDWRMVRTPRARPPQGAVKLRLILGLAQCRGTAWFDDVSLTSEPVEAEKVSHVTRVPVEEKGVAYATNLLANGDVEAGVDGQPAHWTYVGKSARDWGPEELNRFDKGGRPEFSIGRGQGVWSHDMTYAGQGALLNISIDPPLGHTEIWHGRNPVDGYWFSDAMPCTPGKAYMASAWIRPGMPVEEPWFGPLEIQFFDAQKHKLDPVNTVRSPEATVPASHWFYWATMPWVAPKGAIEMRLRFGQELHANEGGWGRTYADNLAVWELPSDVPIPLHTEVGLNEEQFWKWWRTAVEKVKPPYMPAPADAVAYESCRGELLNAVPGNLYDDPTKPVALQLTLTNLLGEERNVTLRITRYDWLGNADAPIDKQNIHLDGYALAPVSLKLPATKKFGTYYLDAEVLENDVVVGHLSGRYAELASRDRLQTANNIWAVTVLPEIHGTGSSYEKEVGTMLQKAGFGLVWLRIYGGPEPGSSRDKSIEETRKIIAWYHTLGIKVILSVCPDFPAAIPFDPVPFKEYGRIIGKEFGNEVVAIGEWGVEQSNNRPPDRPIFRPFIRGVYLTDEDYDIIQHAIHDGIKETAPNVPVLLGNVASDVTADALRRIYGPPINGQIDGVVINAYDQQLAIIQNHLKELDRHGDTRKVVYQEEMANQRSPYQGLERRYGEVEGAYSLVRTWVTLASEAGPRLRSVTMWGFAASGSGTGESDIMMATPFLQPRPQYGAQAVLTNALADAAVVGNRSVPRVTIYEWKRSDGPLWILWGADEKLSLRVNAPSGHLTEMDVMGNRQDLPVANGVATVNLGTAPIYLSGGGEIKIDQKLQTDLREATTNQDAPVMALTLTNNEAHDVAGTLTYEGLVSPNAPRSFSVKGHAKTVLSIPLAKDGLPTNKRVRFQATCHLPDNETYPATSYLNFAFAPEAQTPPDLGGSWKGWERAMAIPFGDKDAGEVVATRVPGQSYKGSQDIYGHLRVMWDPQNLYLGIAATDDISIRQRGRGKFGFQGDSIEFGIQPHDLLEPDAPRLEAEAYLPDGEKADTIDLRSEIRKGTDPTTWKSGVTLTGNHGDANYQIAIPWSDLGGTAPEPGKVISMAAVLNDTDDTQALTGGGNRGRVRWFNGIDNGRDVSKYGDIVLVK